MDTSKDAELNRAWVEAGLHPRGVELLSSIPDQYEEFNIGPPPTPPNVTPSMPLPVIPPAHITAPDDYLPWRKLAAAIIEQAVWDYRTVIERGGLVAIRARARGSGTKSTGRCGGVEDARSAVRFFSTDAYVGLCHFVGVSPEGVRDRLEREGRVD